MSSSTTRDVQAWALDYIATTDLAHKLAPPPPPDRWRLDAPALRIDRPGRPLELERIAKTRRSLPRGKMSNPRRRAQLVHTFWHHELQAAELMCFALLAFPDTPLEFRCGLLAICQDEIRHMALYRDHLHRLGFALGDFPVRDWFWERVATCTTPVQFVALMGIGFEGGNLDHTQRFEHWFEAVGDHHGARVQRVVGDEEIGHVEFALHWFREWTDGLDFDRWCAELVAPLTPRMLQGKQLDRDRRRRAGFPAAFLDRMGHAEG